jgi:hypothetical protein
MWHITEPHLLLDLNIRPKKLHWKIEQLFAKYKEIDQHFPKQQNYCRHSNVLVTVRTQSAECIRAIIMNQLASVLLATR